MTEPETIQKPEGGTPPADDASKLKETLTKVREERNAFEKRLKELERSEADAKATAEKAEMERKGEYEKLSARMAQEKADLEKQLQDALHTHETHLKESAAITAIAAEKGSLKLLKRDVVDALELVKGQVLVKGHPELTVEQFVAKLKADPDYAPAFPALGSGGGSPPPGNGAGAQKPWKEMNLDERSSLFKSNPSLARQLQGA